MLIWLGIHHPSWLERIDVPTMVSYHSLRGRRSLPRARAEWFQDSGGYTELRAGHYLTSAREYAAATWRHASEVGRLAWAAVQDWMCDPVVLARTGATIEQHQRRTLESYLELRDIEPRLPWLPVLQGWELAHYFEHAERYGRAGVDLAALPLVGLGSVAGRQHTRQTRELIRGLVEQLGLRVHAFGLKMSGIRGAREWLASVDSMAWSVDGRRPKGGRCRAVRDHRTCQNCLEYALRWRRRVIALAQPGLWSAGHDGV